MKYVLDDWGFEKFIAVVEAELGRKLRRVDSDRVATPIAEDRLAHVGFHPQKQPGRNYVGVVLPVGRITSEQARCLAEIAETYGNGELRCTVWQNILIPHIRESDVEAAKQELNTHGMGYQASSFRAGLVACAESADCKFAASNTKSHALKIAETLERQFQLDQPINIHVTGCHHSCAQHYIGDIGLLGCKVERGEDMVDGYHVHLGGGWGDRQGIARLLFESVAFNEIPTLIGSIVGGYLANREPDESFVAFVNRHSDESLKSMAAVAV